MMNSSSRSIFANVFLLIIGIAIYCILGNSNPSTRLDIFGKSLTSDSLRNDSVCQTKQLGIPKTSNLHNELIFKHAGFTVGYNPQWKIPNWVVYEINNQQAIDNLPRYFDIVPDPADTTKNCANVDDYAHSKWTMGFMVPPHDMKWNVQAMEAAYYTSNICPQNKSLNMGRWKDLDEYIRVLAKKNGPIYVVCGPLVSNPSKTIGQHKVAVPDGFFKVLLQEDKGQWYAVGFRFPNANCRKPLAAYAISVHDLQDITKMDFFSDIPDSIENQMENHIDFAQWKLISKHK